MSSLYRNHAGPGYSPQMHPLRKAEILGPEPLHDPRNFVPPLSPMFGPAAWDASCEVGPLDACERCGNAVRAVWIFCAGCHRVNPDHQRKLAGERRNDPKPVVKASAKPKAAAKGMTAGERKAAVIAEKRAKRTARDQKRLLDAYRAHRGDVEADAWAERVGLPVTVKVAS